MQITLTYRWCLIQSSVSHGKTVKVRQDSTAMDHVRVKDKQEAWCQRTEGNGEKWVKLRAMNCTRPCEAMDDQHHSFRLHIHASSSAIDKWEKVESSMLKNVQVGWEYVSCKTSWFDEYQALTLLWIFLKAKVNVGEKPSGPFLGLIMMSHWHDEVWIQIRDSFVLFFFYLCFIWRIAFACLMVCRW
jgi:hypothetical protein